MRWTPRWEFFIGRALNSQQPHRTREKRGKRDRRKAIHARTYQIEHLEARQLLTTVPFWQPDAKPEEVVDCSGHVAMIAQDDVTIWTQSWSGLGGGARMEATSLGMGVASHQASDTGPRFDQGEWWEFEFEQPTTLTSITLAG